MQSNGEEQPDGAAAASENASDYDQHHQPKHHPVMMI